MLWANATVSFWHLCKAKAFKTLRCMGFLCRGEHDAYERDLPNHQKRLDHAGSRIELLKWAPSPSHCMQLMRHVLHDPAGMCRLLSWLGLFL